MEIGRVIKQRPHMAYGLNEVKTYEHMAYESNSVDEVVDEFSHLRLNDEQYRTLHCWHAQRLGVDRFRGLAKEAERLGKNPARYFTYLLKKAR